MMREDGYMCWHRKWATLFILPIIDLLCAFLILDSMTKEISFRTLTSHDMDYL